jgi:drug/metabolite transporter superfamily protein YnfA
VAVSSTLLSDALALLVLAACVSAFAGGFSLYLQFRGKRTCWWKAVGMWSKDGAVGNS